MRTFALIVFSGVAMACSASAQTYQQHFYDVHGRVIATTTASSNGGILSRYVLDSADSRTQRVRRVSPARAVQDELRGGESLLPGQAIQSLDNRFTFRLRTDGNLQIVGPSGSLWTSNTDGSQAIVLDMQTDGNAGLRTATFSAAWQSSTGGYPGAFFKMKNDGNLVIMSGVTQIWQSGTCCH